MSRRRVTLCALGLLIGMVGMGTATAQEESVQPTELGSALQGLDATVQQIVQLLQQQVRLQQTSQLMQRVELQRRGLRPLADELRQMRNERRDLERSRKELVAQLDFFEEEMERQRDAGHPENEQQHEMVQRRIKLDLEMMTEQTGDLDQRILDAEIDLHKLEGQIRDWEEVLDEELGLR